MRDGLGAEPTFLGRKAAGLLNRKGEGVMFLVGKKAKARTHIWDDGDTACRMYSTGGLRLHLYEVRERNDGSRICSMCTEIERRRLMKTTEEESEKKGHLDVAGVVRSVSDIYDKQAFVKVHDLRDFLDAERRWVDGIEEAMVVTVFELKHWIAAHKVQML